MRRLLPLLVICWSSACDDSKPPSSSNAEAPAVSASSAPTSPHSDVLTVVNGVPIRVADVHYVLAKQHRRRGEAIPAARVKATLDAIVNQELARQRAEALELDEDPEYQKKLHFMQAPVNNFERETLSEKLYQHELDKASEVSEQDALAHFKANQQRYQTRLHIHRVSLRNDPTRMAELKRQLDSGTPFEEAAAALFPNLPDDAQKPWDMKPLLWHEIPTTWHVALSSMSEGEVSDIITGPKGRQWILRLAKRTKDDSIGYEQVSEAIRTELATSRRAQAANDVSRKLRENAAIKVINEPGPMPAAPDP